MTDGPQDERTQVVFKKYDLEHLSLQLNGLRTIEIGEGWNAVFKSPQDKEHQRDMLTTIKGGELDKRSVKDGTQSKSRGQVHPRDQKPNGRW